MTTAATFAVSIGTAFAADVLTVHYYNEAGLPEKALGQAVETANGALRQAGIQVRWVNCYLESENCRTANALAVSIVEEAPTLRTASFSMGYSVLPKGEQGVYAKVLWNRVKRYAETFDLPAVEVLGNAIAHEIGHLLLGTGEHSREGIMKASWTGAEKATLITGRLRFQGYESARMRRRVMELASARR